MTRLRARAALWSAMTLGLACQPNHTVPPPPQSGRSLVLVILEGEDLVEAWAIEEGGELPPFLFGPGRDVSLYAASYDRTLAEQRIVPGRIEPGAEGPALEAPARAFTLVPGISEWASASMTPKVWPSLRPQRVQVECEDFSAFRRTVQTIEGSSSLGRPWVYAPDRGFALVGNDVGVWGMEGSTIVPYLVNGGVQVRGITGTSTAPVQAVLYYSGESFYAYQRGGKLSRGDREGGFKELGRPPGATTATAAWMVGPVFGDAEVYILDSRGGFWRYFDDNDRPEPDDWLTLLEPTEEDFGWKGGLAYLGFLDVYAAGPQGGKIFRVRDLSISSIPTPEPSTPTTLFHDRYGGPILLGDLEGRVWSYETGAWRKLEAPLMTPVVTIGSFYGGILYGGENGALSYYRERADCTEGVSVASTTIGLGELGNGAYYFFSSSGFFGAGGSLTVTTLSPP